MLVALAAPAMARDRNNDRNDNDNHHQNSFNVFRDFDRFDRDSFIDRFGRFDPFDNAFHNDFGDFEQDANSGDIDQSFHVSSEGNNSNQCVGITGNANTGNAQTQTGVTDFGNANGFDRDRFDRDRFFNRFDRDRFSDFDFDGSGATLDVSGFSSTSCDQQVNQAAAAG